MNRTAVLDLSDVKSDFSPRVLSAFAFEFGQQMDVKIWLSHKSCKFKTQLTLILGSLDKSRFVH